MRRQVYLLRARLENIFDCALGRPEGTRDFGANAGSTCGAGRSCVDCGVNAGGKATCIGERIETFLNCCRDTANGGGTKCCCTAQSVTPATRVVLASRDSIHGRGENGKDGDNGELHF